MMDRGPRSAAAALLVVGLVAATLYAVTAPAASASTSGCERGNAASAPADASERQGGDERAPERTIGCCEVPEPEGESGRAVLVTDLRYERGGDVGAPACAAGLAGSLCLDVWQTTHPLTSTRPSGVAHLCAAMVLVAKMRYAADRATAVPMGG